MNSVSIEAEARTILGKNVKILRRQGLVPGNVYGGGPSTPIQLVERLVAMRLARASKAQLFSLNLAGAAPQTVVVKEVQRHPVSGQVLHIDFFHVAMTERMRVDVPIRLVGEAPAVRQLNGTLLQSLTTISVEALPADLPSGIEVDVSGLNLFEDTIQVRDLGVAESVTVMTPEDEIVAKVSPPALQIEEEPAEAEEAPIEVSEESEAASSEQSEEG